MGRLSATSEVSRHAAGLAAVVALGLTLAGCVSRSASIGTAALQPLHHDDLLWLDRVSFGIDSQSLNDYRRLGRARYLDDQLHPGRLPLPPAIAAQIAALEVSRIDPVRQLAEVKAKHQEINAMAEGPERAAARKSLNEQGNRLAYDALRRDLLRAVYSPAQLQERMTWFWLNHFSVFEGKADLRWLVGDYEETAIRPHVFGRFRDLVMATLEHPAMLHYLDNTQNAAGHVNENYARELMELHILGVDGGYSQQDVQSLARVLTGVGVKGGVFEFNAARHDGKPKTLLGQPVAGRGFAEVEAAVALLVKTPACAHFVARELAVYFVADTPPPALVEHMAQTFQRTDGDIAAVLRTMFLSHEVAAAREGKFKDPMRFVVSSLRFAYDGRPISNTRPVVNWLNGLGERSYGRQTPDGYPLTEVNWTSSGQMSRRFEIARSIGAGSAGLFDPEEGSPATGGGFPQLSTRLYFEAVEPFLAARTREVLAHANSQQEWNTLLLSSPEFAYE